jgi:hypothetical protein
MGNLAKSDVAIISTCAAAASVLGELLVEGILHDEKVPLAHPNGAKPAATAPNGNSNFGDLSFVRHKVFQRGEVWNIGSGPQYSGVAKDMPQYGAVAKEMEKLVAGEQGSLRARALISLALTANTVGELRNALREGAIYAASNKNDVAAHIFLESFTQKLGIYLMTLQPPEPHTTPLQGQPAANKRGSEQHIQKDTEAVETMQAAEPCQDANTGRPRLFGRFRRR